MSYKVPITIASGTVSANLTGYPIMVRLDDMPAAFWTHVKSDGGDIRVKTTDGTQLPQDLVRFDYYDNKGVIFFKADILTGSNNTWNIHYGNAALSKLAVDDANGRNAVWSAYDEVYVFGETGGDDRTGGAMAEIMGDPQLFEIIETSPADTNSHQGVTYDGTYYYTFDTNAIYKWDSGWNLVDSNADPIGDTGLPTVNHLGDGCYHDGKLYIALEYYSDPDHSDECIAVFDPSDLSFIESFDISAQDISISGVCYCDRDGLLYVTDWDDDDHLYKFDPADGSYQGSLTFDKSIGDIQGAVWWHDYFWISCDANDEVLRVSYTGEVSVGNLTDGAGGLFGLTSGGSFEGISYRNDELLHVVDPGATERVDVWKPYDMDLAAGGGFYTSGNDQFLRKAQTVTNRQTYTLGVSASIESKGANRCPLSYADYSVSGTRVSIAYRNSTAIGLGVWDNNNLWLMTDPLVDPTLDQEYRINVVYNGTSYRKIYIDGAESNSQSTITASPAALDSLYAGVSSNSAGDDWTGLVGFVYLYPGVLSDDWIAAEFLNLFDPNGSNGFYEVGSEINDVVGKFSPLPLWFRS